MTSTARQDLVWVGLDVYKISISAAVARTGTDTTEVTNLMADDAWVRSTSPPRSASSAASPRQDSSLVSPDSCLASTQAWLSPPHGAHQDRQRPPAPPALRGGLGLQAPPGRGRPAAGPTARGRAPETVARAWAAQQRLTRRSRALSTRRRTWPAWSPPPWPESSPASSGPR
jgi:hypothetical protein